MACGVGRDTERHSQSHNARVLSASRLARKCRSGAAQLHPLRQAADPSERRRIDRHIPVRSRPAAPLLSRLLSLDKASLVIVHLTCDDVMHGSNSAESLPFRHLPFRTSRSATSRSQIEHVLSPLNHAGWIGQPRLIGSIANT